MHFVAIDLETTGLDPHKHGVVEFGAVYADLAGTFEPKVFHRRIIPINMMWDFYCLKLHSQLIQEIDQLAKAKDPSVKGSLDQVGAEFKMWLHTDCGVMKKDDFAKVFQLERVTAAGKNFGSFDLQFLLHQSTEFASTFRHRSLDPVALYTAPEDKIPPELSLCKERAGLVPRVAHRALQDAWDVVDLLQKKFKA